MRLESFRGPDLSSVGAQARRVFGDDVMIVHTRRVRSAGTVMDSRRLQLSGDWTAIFRFEVSGDIRSGACRSMVRKGGLEPPRPGPPDPKSGASTSSATFARSLREI